MLEKIREKVVTIIGNNRDCAALANRECVQNHFVGLFMETFADSAFEVVEEMRDLFSQDLKSAPLNGEDTGVDPVARRLDRLRDSKELRRGFARLPTLWFGHELIRVNKIDIRNEQRREIELCGEHRVEIDMHDDVGFATEYRIEL